MKMKNIIPAMLMASTALTAHAQTLSSGINLGNLDNSVRPADNFYQYACGGWMKNNPLPAAYSRFGSFDQLGQDNVERVNTILNELLGKTYTKGTTEQKLSDFYKLAMDSVRRNKEGVSPVMPLIKEINAAKTMKELKAIQLKNASFAYGMPMWYGFYADEKNAKMNILNVGQGGITLGQKEYYLDTDDATTAIREAYKKHVVRMFQLFDFNEKEAQKKMMQLMHIETELAKVSKSSTEMRDVMANYNKMSRADFDKRYPTLNLTQMLVADGVNTSLFDEMVVGQPEFLDGAEKLFAGLSPDELRTYMQWDVIMGAASYLSDDVIAANFDFFGKTMSGRKENHPRWKRATSQVEAQMGEALGKMFVARYFPESSKIRMEKLVKNLQVSLAERIREQKWMSPETKKAALDKLNSFYVKIGYPNQWKDMSGLNIDPKLSYYENVKNCQLFWHKWNYEHRAGKPVDKDEWLMTPQTVNAYYNPTTNEICFPAGILQKPFFDPEADDAFNYGAIGVVIGHEMSHGFDDQGRNYDKEGNMTNWWTDEDAAGFQKRADVLINFFNNIKVLPDLNANGALTIGENLADHGGLEVSFNAYKNATKNNPLPTIDGLTADQRFFIAYAGVWAANITEAEIRNRTKSDPHSLGKWRVDATLPHVSAWYDAFNVQPTDKLYLPKEQRIELW